VTRIVRQAVATALVVSAALAAGGTGASRAQTPTPAVITVDPACGQASTTGQAGTYTITVRGDNFNPFTAVLVTFDAAAGGRPDSTRGEADGFGHFQVAIGPDLRPAGSYLVRADDFKLREAVATFSVPCPGTPSQATPTPATTTPDRPAQPTPAPGRPTPAPSTPTLRFDPAIGPPGFVTQALGTGFPPNQPVSLTWDAVPGIPVGPQVVADSSGGFAIPDFLIFHHTPVGAYTLTARPAGTIAFADTTTQFLVVPGSAQPPGFKVRK
jgi:hypothetical protein